MADRTDTHTWKRVLTTIVVAAIIIGVGVTVMQTAATQQQHTNIDQFEDFCHDIYGDAAYTYTAHVVGSHGGLHCTADTSWAGDIHYSQLPSDEWQAYVDGTTSAWQVVENLNSMPNTGPFGLAPQWVWGTIGIILLAFVAFVAFVVGPLYLPRP